VATDGKFFRLGGDRFLVRGVTYGPFPPGSDPDSFGTPTRAAQDFATIAELGANLLRVYSVPPPWFLDLAAEHRLQILVDVPWNQHCCFLDRESEREGARRAVREAAQRLARHPALFAISVANEIPPDILRWSGSAGVEDFLDELIGLVKEVDPEGLATFGNFPPTEYLRPRDPDFLCFNVYLHQANALANYLARLQHLADTKPLILGEVGMDSLRNGEVRQAELLAAQVEVAYRSGVAGMVVYSFSDEWYKDGRLIEDWRFGLTTADRTRKPAFAAVRAAFAAAPALGSSFPKVSVVVAVYNGSRTLKACLDSLSQIHYPDYEVVVVDDGSTDATAEIAAAYPAMRCIRHATNLGLSVARNTGIGASTGEIVAFTDADCRADPDWLRYLVSGLVAERFAGIGGPNLLPPEDSCVAAAVLVSPGGPAHVMLDDRLAEHIPGCNMAFWKWALVEVGGFDPVFRKAGDDVDICWRLQHRGYRLGFSPAGCVWHYRRSAVGDYLRQQIGYGEAEAMLERKHPECFNHIGGSIWRGRIYTPGNSGWLSLRPMIYRGAFGSGLFQSLYTSNPPGILALVTSLEFHVVVTLPLLVLTSLFPDLLPLGLASLLASIGVCIAAASCADLPRRKRRFWSKPLVALLFFLQPIARGWARYRGRLFLPRTQLAARESLDSLSREQRDDVPEEVQYWLPPGMDRHSFLAFLLQRLDRSAWQPRTDAGWNDFDLEIHGSRWTKLQLTTVSEYASDGHHVLRVRLRPALTLASRVAFCTLLGAVVVAIGLGGSDRPWLWLLLLTLPAFATWLASQQRALQRLIAVFLDALAEHLRLGKLGSVSAAAPAADGFRTDSRIPFAKADGPV
jgi:glycosyltransferase involved in cell wall biosynthesis